MTSVNVTKATDLVTFGRIPLIVSEFFSTFNLIICAELIAYCGIAGNVVNIGAFSKQGLHDSVNVTLTALAVSDIGALVTQLMTNIMFSPFWRRVSGLPFTSPAAFALVFYYPHCYFIRVGGVITAFAAFERSLCVVLPMKVKRIITRNVSVTFNILVFLALQLYFFPEYFVSYLTSKFVPETNKTVLYLYYRSDADFVYKVTYFVADMALPYVTFAFLGLFTAVVVVKLKSKAAWRNSVTGKMSDTTLSKATISRKEKKTSVMLSAVSAVFIGCLTPSCALMTAIGVVREMKVDAAYWDLTMLIYAFTSLLESVNCSVPVIIYYNMSTKYRETVQGWFPFLGKQSKQKSSELHRDLEE